MILVLGSGTCIGRIFCAELRRRGHDYLLPRDSDAFDFHSLFDCLRKSKPAFLINASSHPGANSDDSEPAREEMLRVNTILPRLISQVCLMTNTPWGHVSSCGIYSGAKIAVATGVIVEKRLPRRELLKLTAECPQKLRGFTESDEPNFSFRAAPCSFFSGTTALAEEAIRGIGRNYIWRMGLPFSERNEPESLLRQLQTGEKIYDGLQPASHTDDFVRACLDLWERNAAFGIYNVANPGVVTTRQIVELIQKFLKPMRDFQFWQDDAGFYRQGNQAPRANCILDVSKLLATGVSMRPLSEALEDALKNWQGESFHDELNRAAA
ncbi:MAG TPA: sugar nucleotide-binding protein [Verrucomicrobiae bacterium]|nr:sugar nucleotide-binding protein [Verrucomicrobiae bacterium]